MAYRRAVAIFFAAIFVFACDAQQVGTFRISGQVVRRGDNRPVRGTRVTVALVKKRDQQLSTLTGPNGEFSFPGLPAAKYSLEVNDHGWVRAFQQDEGYSTAIAVGNGQDSEHILFVVDMPASVSGSVIDEENEPVRGAAVYLFGGFSVDGRKGSGMNSQISTSSDGRFHFKHLAPGVYYVAAFGRPWYAQNPQQFGTENGQGVQANEVRSELDVAYPLTYYGGSSTPEGAAPLQVTEGTKTEIQIVLHTVPAVHLTVDGAEKQPDQQVQVSLSQIGPGGVRINLPLFGNASGVTGLAPGDYSLAASVYGQGQPVSLGSQAVNVSGNSTVHLNEAVKTSVNGKVLMDGQIPAAWAIVLWSVANREQQLGFIKPDGLFEITAIPPGRYDVRLANSPDAYIQKLTAKGGAYVNGELEVAKGAQIQLTIAVARGVTKINGTVVREKKPVAGAMVLLLPEDTSASNFIARDQSDSDGTFTLPWVAPGRYKLVAIEEGRGLKYADAAVTKPYLERGIVVDAPLPKDANVEIEVQRRK